MYCSVILRGTVRETDRQYTYKIPEDFEGKVFPGSFCKVPFGFGNKTRSAVVMSVSSHAGEGIKGIKEIKSLIVDYPVLTDDLLSLVETLSERFNCTKGDVIELMVPSCVENHKCPTEVFVELVDKDTALKVLSMGVLRSAVHVNIIEYLLERGKCSRKELCVAVSASTAQVKAVEDKGLVRLTNEISTADPDGANSILEDVPTDGKFSETYDLNDEQKEAVNRITDENGSVYPGVHLLFGITGSGKTEVYLKCAQRVIDAGGTVLYLVPEISLTPQTISWIKGRLGGVVAVLHSRLTDRQRFSQWEMIRTGKAKVVVAPRSGVFAPADNVKLIIIDEEHDGSYKSESHPRYSAKDIARMRTKKNNAALVLGSATPSVESFYAAEKGFFDLIELTSRARTAAKLPEIVPVDMKEQVKLGAGDILSIPLRQAMAVAFSQKKQVLLFLNRRGYARTLVCEDCGKPVSCVNCSVGMTLHNNRRTGSQSLICHYCGYMINASEAQCSFCGGKHFTKAGFGTQQLETLLQEVFPHEKVLRMDQDTTVSPGAHREIIERFSRKEASILIGTQMIAKGLDFPDCTVVGVLGADLMISASSYKASERAFQLITQAAGRAGRGDDPGKVFIQSYDPSNPLFRYACTQDYRAFYDTEIAYRQKMNLPPFKAIGEIVLSLEDEGALQERGRDLYHYLSDFLSYQDKSYGFELYGPVPAVIYELRGKYRLSFILKAVNKSAINAVFRHVIEDFDHTRYPLSYDNDPTG
ncbi:MAG: primosomal protein N' [Clostridiales bacterium]|nr:primosomal protein N' [Clostridiales bacterium]